MLERNKNFLRLFPGAISKHLEFCVDVWDLARFVIVLIKSLRNLPLRYHSCNALIMTDCRRSFSSLEVSIFLALKVFCLWFKESIHLKWLLFAFSRRDCASWTNVLSCGNWFLDIPKFKDGLCINKIVLFLSRNLDKGTTSLQECSDNDWIKYFMPRGTL